MSDIFISYHHSDKARVKMLAGKLQQYGCSVWWDRKILPGKTFDEVITEALDSAKCVIVVWTQGSVKSKWVKEEASEGEYREILVPILLDDVKIPLGFRRIQAAKLVDWDITSQHPEFDIVIEAISAILGRPLSIKTSPPPEPKIQSYDLHSKAKSQKKIRTKEKEQKSKIDKDQKLENQGTESIVSSKVTTEKKSVFKAPSPEPLKHKKTKTDDIPAQQKQRKKILKPQLIIPLAIILTIFTIVYLSAIINNSQKKPLRDESTSLSNDDVELMLKNKGFFDKYKNESGKGYPDQYTVSGTQYQQVVIDKTTGLMWQQSGSDTSMYYKDAQKYINELNSKEGFAGYKGWRLPTLEEAMSLMKPETKNGLYIDPLFDKLQTWIWTPDLVKGGSWAWVVDFYNGVCYDDHHFTSNYYVRAVRSGQSSE